jgi:hypothetical protein
MIDFIATSNEVKNHPVKAIQLFVVFGNIGLCDNLHTTIEAVGSYPVTQVRFTRSRINGHRRA